MMTRGSLLEPGDYKDARLDELANCGNVAQFISFSPRLEQRFSRIAGFAPNHAFESISQAITTLIEAAPESRVNLRSFRPDSPQGNEFVYGLSAPNAAEQELRRLAGAGLHVIVNETVDVNDGGVSGVVHEGVMECAPGSTPRIVEGGRIVSVPRQVGERLIETVYHFKAELPASSTLRVEFSIHPVARGYKRSHTIIWETLDIPNQEIHPNLVWPNSFSELIGDKGFGLLIADCIGLPVPSTTVLSRALPPFAFGRTSGSGIKWIRTCPRVPEPGFFPTFRGWTDPFQLFEGLPFRDRIASILVQDEVAAEFSGAMLTGAGNQPIIEGVQGFGDEFMLGRARAGALGSALVNELERLHSRLLEGVGSARMEWAFDGEEVWVLQLQQEEAISSGRVIVPGETQTDVDFDVTDGIAGLRQLVELYAGRQIGINIIGDVGMTSHIADILRRHRIPSRIVGRARPVRD
jgi:hypothetical protein